MVSKLVRMPQCRDFVPRIVRSYVTSLHSCLCYSYSDLSAIGAWLRSFDFTMQNSYIAISAETAEITETVTQLEGSVKSPADVRVIRRDHPSK